jgi:hypothetical protein
MDDLGRWLGTSNVGTLLLDSNELTAVHLRSINKMPTGLVLLDLSQNPIGAEGVYVLIQALLPHDSRLQHLDLSRCKVGDRGATSLIGRRLGALQILKLSDNQISDAGGELPSTDAEVGTRVHDAPRRAERDSRLQSRLGPRANHLALDGGRPGAHRAGAGEGGAHNPVTAASRVLLMPTTQDTNLAIGKEGYTAAWAAAR